jgi:glycosyltransferase involved in cell wall biosynthesis
MKIVLISFCGDPVNIYYSTLLANSLAKRNGVNTIKLFLPKYSVLDRCTCNQGVRLAKFPFPRNLLKAMLKALDLFFYRHLLQEIDSVNPDVVHILFEFRFPFPFAWAMHRKYPIVSTVHEPKHHAGTLLRFVLMNLIQDSDCLLIMKHSDKITVHGQKHKEYLVSKGFPSHKVHIIPHGAFSFFDQWEQEVADTREDSVLFFGEIKPYKGIEYLIEAGKLIEQCFPSVSIVIAGEGDFTKYEGLVKGDSHFIVDNRFIPDSEVAGLFQKASLVVLPYIYGSQSGIISIAGAFKKPVVATDIGHFREMIEDGKTGFIVPSRDARALAEAIARLLINAELRQKMGENAYRAVREKFSWDKIAQKFINVYKEAIEVRRT